MIYGKPGFVTTATLILDPEDEQNRWQLEFLSYVILIYSHRYLAKVRTLTASQKGHIQG